ncbi:MAG TPA: hypothetical protein VLG76_05795 [Rhabdochlamydiaceae bacterium]|nr:hypothetical protein [Rhabdochlamydiaceae bacterium]
MSKKKAFSHAKRFSSATNLGDFILVPDHFEGLDKTIEEFRSKEFKRSGDKQKSEQVNRILLDYIRKAGYPKFLLIAVVHYIDQVNREKVLDNPYTFSNFELWLNQFSELTPEENYLVRAQIVGKWVPRDEYQLFFPIGMDKVHQGSHIVTAHSSPDLDTTVASFWGWVDAFGARVSEGLHIWNVPGGAPPSSIEVALLFYHIFGPNIFTHLAKVRTSLALSSLDLLNQKGVLKRTTDQSALQIDHERTAKAIVLVDESGYFLGDWRNFDVEGVRQVILLLNHCLRWFENDLHVKLISFFAKEKLSLNDVPKLIHAAFGTKIKNAAPAKEFSEKQQVHMQDFLQKVLKLDKGLDSTFEEFALGLKKLKLNDFQECIDLIESLNDSDLFDKHGKLLENRPKIFLYLEKIIMALDKAIVSLRNYTERLEIALEIKTKVFGYYPQVISYRAEVDEIRNKMGAYPYLTVTSTDKEGKMVPLGVVHAHDLHQSILGTVSLRDFCNREETKIPAYLDVISVIDHHKSNLNTFSPPVAHISDSQSSNALVAELAFLINDKYSTMGLSLEEINAQIAEAKKDLSTPRGKRIFQRLLQRHTAATSQKCGYFIDPVREFVEYLHYLYAILDDTDLLTKISRRDVECVTSLINRLKSLMVGKEVEVIDLDGLECDQFFIEKAAKRILQNAEMYSLYRKIYLAKERLVEENLELCAEGKSSSIFVDTKEQNGCCRVGQTKMFANNFATFRKYAPFIRREWYKQAKEFYKDTKEFDLHLHMVSRVAGAEDLYAGTVGKSNHKDEMWIWIPSTEQAIQHLTSFLNQFRSAPQIMSNPELEIEFLGDNAKELRQIFKESFIPIPETTSKKKEGEPLPIAVLRFRAGAINSRKAMVSPYLPRSL